MSAAPAGSEVSRRLTLINKRGLHARASAKFVHVVDEHAAEVEVTSHNSCGEERVVADSIMELLMLGAACGEDITVTATGPDAEAVVAALAALVGSRFGEGE